LNGFSFTIDCDVLNGTVANGIILVSFHLVFVTLFKLINLKILLLSYFNENFVELVSIGVQNNSRFKKVIHYQIR
jgi:hypothetical protein